MKTRLLLGFILAMSACVTVEKPKGEKVENKEVRFTMIAKEQQHLKFLTFKVLQEKDVFLVIFEVDENNPKAKSFWTNGYPYVGAIKKSLIKSFEVDKTYSLTLAHIGYFSYESKSGIKREIPLFEICPNQR